MALAFSCTRREVSKKEEPKKEESKKSTENSGTSTPPETNTNTAFVSTWEVAADGLDVTLPLVDKGTYDFVVDWGDGTAKQTVTTKLGGIHDYTTAGTYTITITGTIEGFSFGDENDFGTGGPIRLTNPDAEKIRTISSWGPLKLGATKAQFAGAAYLVITATDSKDLLSKTTDLSYAFYEATSFNSDISGWDVSQVTNMSLMFFYAMFFNQPIGGWNVSQVTDMSWMFYEAEAFNQPLRDWDVSQVTDMSFMFSWTEAFNQPLRNWNVSQVTNMSFMFSRATAFNQNLRNWDVSQVTDMSFMFNDATAFSQNLSGWDVRKVTKYENFASGSGFANDNSKWPAKFR